MAVGIDVKDNVVEVMQQQEQVTVEVVGGTLILQGEGTGTSGTAVRIKNITLLASAWVGSDNLYSQVVNIDGVTENSKVDITPSVEQLMVFYEKDLTFVTENDGGIITIYAIGQKPANDYVVQVTITEVEYE